MPQIFLSYRRDDSAYVAGMIKERLEEILGDGSVFYDMDKVPIGVDFRDHIDKEVSKCDLLLAVIGDHWLTVQSKDGGRRLDDPSDFVRIEIESALARDTPVVPVLVGKARMPDEVVLPDTLKPLAYRNCAEVRTGQDTRHHLDRLVAGLKTHFPLLECDGASQDILSLADNAQAGASAWPMVEMHASRRGRSSDRILIGALVVVALLAVATVLLLVNWPSSDPPVAAAPTVAPRRPRADKTIQTPAPVVKQDEPKRAQPEDDVLPPPRHPPPHHPPHRRPRRSQ